MWTAVLRVKMDFIRVLQKARHGQARRIGPVWTGAAWIRLMTANSSALRSYVELLNSAGTRSCLETIMGGPVRISPGIGIRYALPPMRNTSPPHTRTTTSFARPRLRHALDTADGYRMKVSVDWPSRSAQISMGCSSTCFRRTLTRMASRGESRKEFRSRNPPNPGRR